MSVYPNCCIFERNLILNMRKHIGIILSLFIIALALTACGSSELENIPVVKRTVLVYMVATNSLYSEDTNDLEEIEASVQKNGTNGGRLLVYWATYNKVPQLIEITQGKNSAKRKVLKEFANDSTSTTKERMQDVINSVKQLAPADDYGMILWSHASGWASSLYSVSKSAKPLSYGEDYGKEMPIDQLAEAIPTGMFNFIYADACYMACVEVAYELRNKANYLIGSVTELPVDGMDYTNNIPCFFADEPKLKEACANTFNKYDALAGSYRSCTISLVDCRKMDELASLCREIHKNGNTLTDFSGIQVYKRTEPYLFFDFVQYTKKIANEEQQNRLDSLMDEVVPYKGATPYIFNNLKINADNYSGLSSYIVGSTATGGVNEIYYRTLSWYKNVIE